MSSLIAQKLAAIAAQSNVVPTKIAPKADFKPDWANLDVESLTPAMIATYEEYKLASKAAAELRKTFESLVSDGIDPADGEKVIFAYKFGKLSVAIVPDDKPAKRSSSAISLADFKAK
jgi:hypothetical protein